MSNWGLLRTIYLSLIAQTLVALAFVFTVHDHVAAAITIVLFPFTSSLMLPPLQSRIIALAAAAPNLASASIHSAFNVANSLGAWLGGLTIAAGFGYASTSFVSAELAGLGLVLALVSWGLGLSATPRRIDFFTDEERAQLLKLAMSAALRRPSQPQRLRSERRSERPLTRRDLSLHGKR
jgi:DHA1 family inner membrane transport protein